MLGERVLNALPIRIGRNALNECSIVHPFVSDFHAVVDVHDGSLSVRDLQSRNGVSTPSGERIGHAAPFDIGATGNAFVVGRTIHIQIEPFEQAQPVGARLSATHGSVLGNPAMLQSGPGRLPAAVASPPLPGLVGPGQYASPYPRAAGGSSPPLDRSLPALPPLAGMAAPRASRPPAPIPAPAPGPVGPGTQHFALSTESLALIGLRELAASLAPGVPLETTGDVARLLTKLHDTVEVFCRCFVPLREGYAQFISSMDLHRGASQRTINRSPLALRVETARDPATLAAALLDWRSDGYDAPDVVESIFADLMMHHIALVDGVSRGVKALLEELSPESIERAAAEKGGSAVFGHHRAIWKTYESRYAEVANETRTFELVFGAEFAASYREYFSRQGKQDL